MLSDSRQMLGVTASHFTVLEVLLLSEFTLASANISSQAQRQSSTCCNCMRHFSNFCLAARKLVLIATVHCMNNMLP